MTFTVSEQEIRNISKELGWDDVGFTPAKIPEADIDAYKNWLASKRHADLKYMENQIRCTPEDILPGAKTAILFVTYYRQPQQPFVKDSGLIAAYARGRDYHNVHRSRLKKFIRWLEQRTGATGIARGFSDSKPILEKALAVQAGLGWFGKNSLLIHRKYGTFTLLSGVLTTLSLPYAITAMRQPRCGSCTRCLDACPTNALVSPYILEASRCLSYHLIESKAPIPDDTAQKNPGYVFGCDICQDVCPHNWRKPLSPHVPFSPAEGIGEYLSLSQIEELESTPEKLHGTPLKRRGIQGLKHTASTLQPNR